MESYESQYASVISEYNAIKAVITNINGYSQTISTKNAWLNNAKKLLYIHAKYDNKDKYSVRGVRIKRTPLEIKELIQQLKINLPNQIRLFQELLNAINMVISQADDNTLAYNNSRTYSNEIIELQLIRMRDSIQYIEKIIELLKAEEDIVSRFNIERIDETLQKFATLFKNEHDIYIRLRNRDNTAQVIKKMQAIEKQTRKDNKIDNITDIGSISIAVIALLSTIGMLINSIMTRDANANNFWIINYLSVMIMNPVLRKKDANMEKKINETYEELSTTLAKINIPYKKFKELTQGWEELKAIPDPDPDNRL